MPKVGLEPTPSCEDRILSRYVCHTRGIAKNVAVKLKGFDCRAVTNRPFREWGKLFDVDNTLATALIDRLMHHGEGIVIQGESYRMRDKDPDSTDE